MNLEGRLFTLGYAAHLPGGIMRLFQLVLGPMIVVILVNCSPRSYQFVIVVFLSYIGAQLIAFCEDCNGLSMVDWRGFQRVTILSKRSLGCVWIE